MVSMVDYLEREVGYGPRTGHDRMRVARALGDLPELSEALRTGELFHSAIRELVRVATPRTESAWRDATRGKNVRQIEKLVAGHRPGDLPDDPPDEQARVYRVVFEEVDAATFALMRQVRQVLDEEHGTRMTDTQVLAAMAGTIIDGAPRAEHTGRARSQIYYTVCPCCDRATQEGAGVQVPVSAATLEQARCDAQHVGSAHVGTLGRAKQDIPPSTVRLIWRRDGGVCQTPGCRSARGLEIHHVVSRANGGSHDPSNLTLRCSACHTAHHEGRLTIRGVAPHALETIRNVTVPEPFASHDAATLRNVTESEPRAALALRNVTSSEPRAALALRNVTSSEPRAALAMRNVTSSEPRAALSMRNVIASDPDAPRATQVAVPSERENGPLPLSPKYQTAARRTELIKALTTSGWPSSVARPAVDAASAHVGPNATFEEILRESFRRCVRP